MQFSGIVQKETLKDLTQVNISGAATIDALTPLANTCGQCDNSTTEHQGSMQQAETRTVTVQGKENTGEKK